MISSAMTSAIKYFQATSAMLRPNLKSLMRLNFPFLDMGLDFISFLSSLRGNGASERRGSINTVRRISPQDPCRISPI